MSTTKLTLTTLKTLKRLGAFQVQANRLGTGLVVATDPPADFLSREHSSLSLPNPEPYSGLQVDQGDRDMRYPGLSGSPTSSVGRCSGATAVRTGRTTDLRIVRSTPVTGSDYPSPATGQNARIPSATLHLQGWQQIAVRQSIAGK